MANYKLTEAAKKDLRGISTYTKQTWGKKQEKAYRETIRGKGDVHKLINYPKSSSRSMLFSFDIFSPRLTEMLTAGWLNPIFNASSVACMPKSLTAQKHNRLRARTTFGYRPFLSYTRVNRHRGFGTNLTGQPSNKREQNQQNKWL